MHGENDEACEFGGHIGWMAPKLCDAGIIGAFHPPAWPVRQGDADPSGLDREFGNCRMMAKKKQGLGW